VVVAPGHVQGLHCRGSRPPFAAGVFFAPPPSIRKGQPWNKRPPARRPARPSSKAWSPAVWPACCRARCWPGRTARGRVGRGLAQRREPLAPGRLSPAPPTKRPVRHGDGLRHAPCHVGLLGRPVRAGRQDRPALRTERGALLGRAATSALACFLDFRLTPRRFTPGFEHWLFRSALVSTRPLRSAWRWARSPCIGTRPGTTPCVEP
jgi:hypothetical protein